MDRFARPLFACGFGLFLAATGCRSTQPEVPPGRPLAKDDQSKSAIQFSSDGHAPTAQGSAPYMQPNLGGTDIASGIAGGVKPDGSGYGAPAGGYGPPGSAGTANPSANLSDPSTVRASSPSPSPASIPLTGTPPAGALPSLGTSSSNNASPSTLPDLNVAPPRDNSPMPSQVIQPPVGTGTMGTPDQAPSPM
jgi:hypothetical protein